MKQKPLLKVTVSHLKKALIFGLALSLSFWPQMPAKADTQTFTTSGTFTVPAGVTSIVVELWGGGGAGGAGLASTNRYGGGGGAGGQYAKKTIAVSPGANYAVSIGSGGTTTAGNGNSGGSTTFGSTVVVARGGAGGLSYSNGRTGGAGSTTGGVGDTVYAGGNGYAGATTYSGGGGSGAGSGGTGNNASTITGGALKANYGGAGGAGSSATSGSGGVGGTYGGGGGGATKAGVPGAGGAGYAIVTYTVPVTYRLDYKTDGNGTISGVNPQTVPDGGDGQQVCAVANSGYTFDKWDDGMTAEACRKEIGVRGDMTVTANFKADTYTLIYSASAGGSLSGTTIQYVSPGGSGTAVTATPNTGYYFNRWDDGPTSNPRTDTNVSGNISVTAVFSLNNYTLTYTPGAGGYLSGNTPQTVAHGSNGTAVQAIANTGYHFVSWSDGQTANPRTDTGVTGNITVTANFAINTYTLTYTAGANGSITGTSPQTVNHGANGTAVTPTPVANYHFVQWSDGSTSNPRTDTNVTANKTVSASFAINTYTLTYTAGAGGTISGASPQTVNHGANGTAVTPTPNTGYHFVNWSDGSTSNPRTDTSVTANKSVTANFAINTYTLTYTAGTNGTIAGTSPQTVNHGANGTAVTPTPNTGYHFVNWSDSSTSNPRTDSSVTSNITVTATFAINTYTLTYAAGANGTLSGTSPQTVNHGANGTAVTANANTGYHFVNWSDGQTANPRTDTSVTANKSVIANFAINTYTLTYTAGANGTVSGTSPQTVNHGANGTTVTATPNANFTFSQWSDGITANPRTDTNVTTNKSVTAQFSAVAANYTLTYTAGANGSISGTSPQTVASGGSGTAVTANASANYHFVNWSDGSTSNPRTDTNVTANKSVTANFAINNYTLLYGAGVGGSLTGTTTQYVNHGSNGTAVTAVPSTGYHFVNWSDGQTANPRTDTNVTANKSVTATFAINTYTLTYAAGTGGTVSGTSPQTVNHGANGTAVTATPNASYNFSQWSDGITANPRTDTNVTTNKSVTAQFTAVAPNYTLTYTAGSGGSISGTSPQTVVSGGNGTQVTAVANSGYHFVNWSDGITTAARTETNVTSNKSVTANFALNTYTLTYLASNGTISGVTPQTVNHGANGSAVTAVPYTNYHFLQWSDGQTANPRTDTNITADKTVTAEFAVNELYLTYKNSTGGTLSGSLEQTVRYGESGTAVTATPTGGYNFSQWSDGKTDNPRIDKDVIDNITVTAEYSAISPNYTLTYLSGANGAILGTTPQTVKAGEDGQEVEAVPNTGYHFTSWSDTSTQNPRKDVAVNANKTVTASFAINTYTLMYNPGVGGYLSGTAIQYVQHGGNGTAVTATPNPGYTFLRWSDGSTSNPRTDLSVTGDLSVTAVFQTANYTLTYTANTNGTISGTSPQSVPYGGSGTDVTAVPNTGYHFTQWSDGSTQNPRADKNVTANKTVSASFAINTYTLAYVVEANGSLTGSTTQTVNHGSNGTAVTAVPSTGYHFNQWSDGSTTTPRTDTNVTGDNTYSASFAINTYTLTYAAGAGGTLTGATSQTVAYGANGSAVTAVPNSGYNFSQWSDGSTANPRIDTNITAGKSVTAQFTLAAANYTLTYLSGANGNISGLSPQTVVAGGNGSAVTAVPDAHYHFTSWSDASTANPRTDTNVTSNKTLTASFAVDTYTVMYSAAAGGYLNGTAIQYIGYGGYTSAVTATPNAGYHFTQWSDGSTQNPRTDTNITADKSVTASFAVNTYTVSYTAVNGSITGNSNQTVNHGANATAVTAVGTSGYEFVQWSDGLQTLSRTDTNITSNRSFEAQFSVAGVTTNSISGGTNKVMVGSFKGGLVADLPLKLKYTSFTATPGSEIFTDRTPYSNNATNYGATAGATALTFDGTNDYVSVPVTPSLQAQTNLTMSAWVKPDPSYTGDMIMVGDNAYYLTIASDWSVQTYWYGKSAAGYHSSGASTITAGSWNFVTAVWSASDVKLYVNGSLKKTVASTGVGTASGNLFIGARDASGARAFKGSIANVKIHNKALSASEVEELYGQGIEESAFMVGGN